MSYHYSLVDFEISIVEDSKDYSLYISLIEFDVLFQSFDVEKYSKSSFTSTQIIFDTSIIMTVLRDSKFNFYDQFIDKDNISTAR